MSDTNAHNKPKKKWLCIHMIDSVPPSCLNRDEFNVPKTAQYGGVTRGRVSSQSEKRRLRHGRSFEELLAISAKFNKGERSVKLPERVQKRLIDMGVDPAVAHECAIAIPSSMKSDKGNADTNGAAGEGDADKTKAKSKGKTKGKVKDEMSTPQILFYDDTEINTLCTLIKDGLDKNDEPGQIVKQILTSKKAVLPEPQSLGIVVCGRMITNGAFINVDAALQVSHSISTHRAEVEGDFYTAVDDYKTETKEQGSSMMGTIEFNSAVFYRYANLDIQRLYDVYHSSDLVAVVVRALVIGMAESKANAARQNSFAAHTPVSGILLVLQEGCPTSMAGAFERPVAAPEEGGFVQPSIDALYDHWNRYTAFYGSKDIKLAAYGGLTKPSEMTDSTKVFPWTMCETIDKMIDAINAEVTKAEPAKES